jgi:hypothetical protein
VSSENVTLEHNQSVDLSCTAVGCPLPVSLNWTDANDRVVTEKFTTDGEMLPVNVSLGGVNATGGKSMYKCSANNGIETKTIEVEVVIKGNKYFMDLYPHSVVLYHSIQIFIGREII